jgi:glycosyltransferase involved in cell wall biosynthesis
MEALYAGIPVILSDVGGAFEQLGGNDASGYLIPNPAGNPLNINWKSIRRVLYGPQSNQEQLVSAMTAAIDARAHWETSRHRLIEDAATRFDPDVCLQRHAEVPKSVVNNEKSGVREKVL